jgi:hypothetical protein
MWHLATEWQPLDMTRDPRIDLLIASGRQPA